MMHPTGTTDGETIQITFTRPVALTGDPHQDADNAQRAEDQRTQFLFYTRTLPGALWEKLLRDNKPVEQGYDYNPETFPPALIAASVVGWTVSEAGAVVEDEPRPPTAEEAQELWENWPQWARAELLHRLEAQNVQGPSLGKARSRRNVPAAAIPAPG